MYNNDLYALSADINKYFKENGHINGCIIQKFLGNKDTAYHFTDFLLSNKFTDGIEFDLILSCALFADNFIIDARTIIKLSGLKSNARLSHKIVYKITDESIGYNFKFVFNPYIYIIGIYCINIPTKLTL